MNRCLVICPTINRRDKFVKMIDSFYQTSQCSDLIMLNKKGSITDLINKVNFNKYDYVSVTNDDFIYHTFAWDTVLINTIENKKGYGIAFGDDGNNNTQLPTTAVMSTLLFQILGWIQLPTLNHLCGDMVWQYLGQKLNCLYYVSHVKIEHQHFMFQKSEKDSIYEKTNSKEMYRKDNEAFRHWVRNNSIEDINKLQRALEVFTVQRERRL